MGSIDPGATLTGGIQDIAALLPLLGTEQCEDHIGSALTKGYLYTAATPLSIFGSLGMARAGLKTLVAGFVVPKWRIVGAQILADMGFKPLGTNLSLIMVDDHDKDKRYLVERRLDELVEQLHIDRSRIVKITHKCARWNATMMLSTAISCLFNVVPYVYINVKGDTTLNHTTRWTFPLLRALGGFLTATMIQLVIQIRVTTLSEKHLHSRRHEPHVDGTIDDSGGQSTVDQSSPVMPNESNTKTVADERRSDPTDLEKALEQKDVLPDGNSFLTWGLLALLLVGVLALIVGYIGCFSIVQSDRTLAGPISWLCLEAGLSLIRMILWGLNPTSDDAPPLEFVLELDKHAPLLTCMKDNDEITEEKVLPLTRASEFLTSITSFVGLIKRFTHPDLTLYYTLTRKKAVHSVDDAMPETPGERILYITIFDHKERTTRIYTRDANAGDHFYSALSPIPVLDLEHDQLDTELGVEIDPTNDPVAVDVNVRSMLAAHYQSIINQMRFMSSVGSTDPGYAVVNSWTMQAKDTTSRREWQRTQKDEDHKSGRPVTTGHDTSLLVDHRFLELGRLERKRRSLIIYRGQWIEDYMRWVMQEKRGKNKGLPRRVDGMETALGRDSDAFAVQEGEISDKNHQPTGSRGKERGGADAEIILLEERYQMEMLLVDEVGRWEEQLLGEVQRFSDELDSESERTLEKRQLVRTWSRNCWRRLDTEMRAMDARMKAAQELGDMRVKDELSWRWRNRHDEICKAWKVLITQYVGAAGSPSLPTLPSPPSVVDRLNARLLKDAPDRQPRLEILDPAHRKLFGVWWDDMDERLRKEGEDVEWRLDRRLAHCDEFWSDRRLFVCRHSRSKWLVLDSVWLTAPLAAWSHELKKRHDIVFIVYWFDTGNDLSAILDTIRDMPSVTSIYFTSGPITLPSIEDNHHLLSITGNFVSPGIQKVLDRNQHLSNQIIISCDSPIGYMSLPYSDELFFYDDSSITISFVGPASGTVTLRLVHCAPSLNGTTLTCTIQGSSRFELPVLISWTIDDITLRPGPSDQLSFEPNARNELILAVNVPGRHQYRLGDIQLLDQHGEQFNPQFQPNLSSSSASLLQP